VADPMYRQIADDLRHQIEEGSLAPGQQLPTELELRERYNASRNTVRDAIKWLITRGLVVTRPGQGTFVVEQINPFVTTLTDDPETGLGGGEGNTYIKEVTAGLRRQQSSLPRVEIQQADHQLATELQLETGSTVVGRHQRRFIDDTPWSLQTSFYPMKLVEKGAQRLLLADDIGEGTVVYLREGLGIGQVGYRDLITVRAPDTTETAFFKLPDDGRVSVVETRRTAFDEAGAPFRLTVSVYPADRNQFAINVGKVPTEVAQPAIADSPTAAAPDDAGTERNG
jgi:DNA-binding GntR family transcriptional regulator